MTSRAFIAAIMDSGLIGRSLRLLLLAYGTLCLYAWFLSERQVFLPQPARYGEAEISQLLPVGAGRDSRQIALLSLPNPAAELTLLYSHGNGDDLGGIRPMLELIRDAGYNVVAYDYAGYGLSEGRPTERNSYQDIEAVYRYLVDERQIPPDKIVLYGRSVGGGPSLYLASREPVGGLIVESSFVSIFRVLTRVPLLPFDKFPSLSRIRQVQQPVLILHGTADTVIPFWHGKALYAAAPGPKRSLWVEGAGHNDLQVVAGDRYVQALREFSLLVRSP